jgi:hypothetical protein
LIFALGVPAGHDDGEKTGTHERCTRIVAQVGAKRCAHPIFGTTNHAGSGISGQSVDVNAQRTYGCRDWPTWR